MNSIIFLCLYLVFVSLSTGQQKELGKRNKLITDAHGAIIRGDTVKKEIALVFTGDTYGDGGEMIRQVLHTHQIQAAFFLTGNFYSNPAFTALIRQLQQDGHYLGAHSDRHMLYADWTKRDSLLITHQAFRRDLLKNYKRMKKMGINTADAPYFLPPYEWYNASIAAWTRQLQLQLINFTPGTLSTADYTYPGMGERYRSAEVIYQSIIHYEAGDRNGLNGFILLLHIGTDPQRTDKFYDKLDILINELKGRGYHFANIHQLLE